MAAKKKDDRPSVSAEGVSGTSRAPPPGVPSVNAAFLVVGIGASAGGLKALQLFLSHVPANPGMTFVVVTHQAPNHRTLLVELLGKYTSMPVHEVTEETKIEPNTVYVSRPGKNLGIESSILKLFPGSLGRGSPLPIDFFLRSLAADQKDMSVAVILSGSGTDGSLGSRAVKAESGMTIVQDPRSAEFSGMPASAIATGGTDFVLCPEEMGATLLAYSERRRTPDEELASREVPASVDLKRIFALLRKNTGHDFSGYKQSTLRRRIARRLHLHNIERVRDYLRYLEESPQELDLLFKDLLINVTSFFRDPEAFEALAETALPELVSARPEGHTLRVWIPACSTGEEAHSLAMLLLECRDRLDRQLNFQIFATDLDSGTIDAARTSSYPDGIRHDVTPERLSRFFRKEKDRYIAQQEIRDPIVFAVQNVLQDPPFTRLDLICCRNLLIYLEPEQQAHILELFHYALNPGGILFLGSYESRGDLRDLFTTIDKKWRIFRRKESAVPRARREFATPPLAIASRRARLPAPTSPAAETAAQEPIGHLLTSIYAPPSAIIDARGQIHQIHGRTGLYLEPAAGPANLNILEMARPGLRRPLASAIRQASGQSKGAVTKEVRVKADADFVHCRLSVRRISEPASLQGLLLVAFEATSGESSPDSQRPERPTKKLKKGTAAQLEEALQFAEEELQHTIEGSNAFNQELAAANEELRSMNEELQSASEELETSKEEAQSLNEELQTVNTELRAKIEELSYASDDMTNLLNSTDIATVFLDRHLSVKRFTPKVVELIHLIQADVGRPIADLAWKLDYDDLVDDVQTVVDRLEPREQEVRGNAGRWYLVRMIPYRTAVNAIDGVVITFQDITALKEATRAASKAQAYAQSVVETVREPLVVLSRELRVVSANRSFYRVFDSQPEQTEGQLFYELGKRQWDIPRLRRLLERIVAEDAQFDDFAVEHSFDKIGNRKMLLNARRIESTPQGDSLILLAIEEVTAGSRPRVRVVSGARQL